METIALNAPGISCGHCVATVENAVGKIEGVQSVSADAGSKDVTIAYDESKTDVSTITAALKEAGYPAKS